MSRQVLPQAPSPTMTSLRLISAIWEQSVNDVFLGQSDGDSEAVEWDQKKRLQPGTGQRQEWWVVQAGGWCGCREYVMAYSFRLCRSVGRKCERMKQWDDGCGKEGGKRWLNVCTSCCYRSVQSCVLWNVVVSCREMDWNQSWDGVMMMIYLSLAERQQRQRDRQVLAVHTDTDAETPQRPEAEAKPRTSQTPQPDHSRNSLVQDSPSNCFETVQNPSGAWQDWYWTSSLLYLIDVL